MPNFRGGNAFKTIHDFGFDGAIDSKIAVDAGGDIFGIAWSQADGGASIFELKAGADQPTHLASIGAVATFGGVVLDGMGDVFGVVSLSGGENGVGYVFELVKGESSIARLASFDAATNQVSSGIAVDAQGDVYGASSAGVFEIVRGSGEMTTLFQTPVENSYWTGVMLDSAGDLFGTDLGPGSVFMLPAGGTTPILVALLDSRDGLYPGFFTVDGDGNVYGSTAALADGSDWGKIFEVPNVATVYHLAILQGPSTVVAGEALGDVQVAVEDAAGNVVTSDNSNITLALRPGDYAGIATVQAVKGIATFSGLTLTQAGAFTLRATDGVFKAATEDLEVVAGAPASIGFVQVPGQVTAGNTFNMTMQAYDAYGNPTTTFPGVDASNGAVQALVQRALGVSAGGAGGARISVRNGANGAPLTVSAVTASRGRATIGVELQKAGSYALRVDDGAYSAEMASGVTVVADAAHARLAFVQQPTTGVAGTRMAPMRVEIEDGFGNPVMRSGTIQLKVASGPGGIVGQSSASGVGTVGFNNVSLSKAGKYTLQASFGKMTVVSNAFDVVLPASQVKVGTVANAVAGRVIPAIVVQVVDGAGKLVTLDRSFVTVSLVGGGKLMGTTRVQVVNGVARFVGLSVARAGSFKLVFSDGGMKAGTSNLVVGADVKSAKVAAGAAAEEWGGGEGAFGDCGGCGG